MHCGVRTATHQVCYSSVHDYNTPTCEPDSDRYGTASPGGDRDRGRDRARGLYLIPAADPAAHARAGLTRSTARSGWAGRDWRRKRLRSATRPRPRRPPTKTARLPTTCTATSWPSPHETTDEPVIRPDAGAGLPR